jgi:hypothetical protein
MRLARNLPDGSALCQTYLTSGVSDYYVNVCPGKDKTHCIELKTIILTFTNM